MAIQDQINRITNEVGTQSGIIANIKDTLSDLDDGLSAMSEEVSELVDMPEEVNLTTMTEGVAAANGEIVVQSELIEQIREALQGKGIKGKEEQRKEVTITENGIHSIEPDEGYTLSGVEVNVDVEDDFIGIKYLNFSGSNYNLPKTVDASALDKTLIHPDILKEQNKNHVLQAVNGHCLDYTFVNLNGNANGGFFAQLEEAYLPTKAISLNYTFQYCTKLKHIYGIENIMSLNVTFDNCWSMENIPYFPNLTAIGNRSFSNCKALTKYVVPPKVTSIHTGAFTNTSALLDIYVAFAEGAISGAPWGATNATIHYNTQYDTDGNPIIEEV